MEPTLHLKLNTAAQKASLLCHGGLCGPRINCIAASFTLGNSPSCSSALGSAGFSSRNPCRICPHHARPCHSLRFGLFLDRLRLLLRRSLFRSRRRVQASKTPIFESVKCVGCLGLSGLCLAFSTTHPCSKHGVSLPPATQDCQSRNCLPRLLNGKT